MILGFRVSNGKFVHLLVVEILSFDIEKPPRNNRSRKY